MFTSIRVASCSLALAVASTACNSTDDPSGAVANEHSPGGASGSSGRSETAGASSGGTSAGGTPTGYGGSGGASTGYGGSGGGVAAPDAGGDACVSETLTVPSGIPESLVPQGATLAHFLHAKGTQTYDCVQNSVVEDGGAPTYDWGGTAHASTPEALVYDDCGVAKVHHFAGPTWEWIKDGSSIKGVKVAAVPQRGTIPWVLLKTTVVTPGKLSDVTFVQRLETAGGAPPAGGCDSEHVGDTVSVPYTAGYYFYTGPNDGG